MSEAMIKPREHVGDVPVESGKLLIIDPCYAFDDDFTGEPEEAGMRDRPTYNACSHAAHEWGYGDVGLGVVAKCGDNLYPVFVEYGESGDVVRVVIELVSRTTTQAGRALLRDPRASG